MSGPEIDSRKPLWIIIAAFSVALVANGFLVYYALNTWTGLETEQHYVKGLAYNDNIEGAKRSQALGWSSPLKAEFLTGQPSVGTVDVLFTDNAGHPLTDLDVRIIAIRPTLAGHDQKIDMTHTGKGVYSGNFSLPLKGQWDMRILAWRGEEHYQRVERIETP